MLILFVYLDSVIYCYQGQSLSTFTLISLINSASQDFWSQILIEELPVGFFLASLSPCTHTVSHARSKPPRQIGREPVSNRLTMVDSTPHSQHSIVPSEVHQVKVLTCLSVSCHVLLQIRSGNAKKRPAG